MLPALWISPLSDPMRMLGAARLGCRFYPVSSLLTIRNRISDGRLSEALFGNQGAAGLLLYLGLLSSAWRYVSVGK